MIALRPFALAFAPLILSLACGGSGPAAPSREKMVCRAPIGPVPREDCAAVAADFSQLAVGGAMPLAGSGKDAEKKIEAIRAVSTLASSIKEQRVKLCEEYTKCRVPLDEHDAQDKALSQAMSALFDLWNKRRFSSADEVLRFREAVRALDRRVNAGADGSPPAPQPPRVVKAGDAFAQVSQPDVVFRAGGGSVTISATSDRERDALESKPDALALSAGHRYHLNVTGSYVPGAAPTIRPGDEITVRLRYSAARAGALSVALRSLEDPEASEAHETWRTSGTERSAKKEIKLTADPAQTGFSVGLAVTEAPVEIEALEVLRAGNVVLTARSGDAATRTDCSAKPSALACGAGTGDRLTLGAPASYLTIGVRDTTGRRATTRTLSLEGGRSVDAAVGEDGRLIVSLVGSGSATVEQVEITDLGM